MQSNGSSDTWTGAARNLAKPFPEARDLEPLIEKLGQARIVMLGESTHGTHEFYDWRRLITEWLVVRHGFNFIAVEGDWPACRSIDRFARAEDSRHALHAFEAFRRWPTWMWANTDILRLVEWLRQHNARSPQAKNVGFYGLDIYSFFESIEGTLSALEKINPFLARTARSRYACFDPFQGDEHRYARSLFDNPAGCEEEVVRTLQDVLGLRLNGVEERQSLLFDARQNARIVRNAERYYRTIIHADDNSWNVRDGHMLETLETLLDHHGPQSKAVVWAHNTHVGDHRHTDMGAAGLVNLGGLARQRFGSDRVALVGFGTYEGSVIASHAWEGPIESMTLPSARPQSAEALLHEVAGDLRAPRFYLSFDHETRRGPLAEVVGQRAVGVVYDPRHEQRGNYVSTSLARRYDAFIFLDETRALEPLHQRFERSEIPQTWPSGT